MIEEENLNKYYIRLNENGRVIKAFSTAFEEYVDGDILVGSGTGSQFRADEDFLSSELKEFANIENGLNITNASFQNILKYENGVIMPVTDEELEYEKYQYSISDEALRNKRNVEFKLIDKYQLPLLYNELTLEQQEELKAYRKAWLDITETSLKVRSDVTPNRPIWLK